jgi:hypothetical protein
MITVVKTSNLVSHHVSGYKGYRNTRLYSTNGRSTPWHAPTSSCLFALRWELAAPLVQRTINTDVCVTPIVLCANCKQTELRALCAQSAQRLSVYRRQLETRPPLLLWGVCFPRFFPLFPSHALLKLMIIYWRR